MRVYYFVVYICQNDDTYVVVWKRYLHGKGMYCCAEEEKERPPYWDMNFQHDTYRQDTRVHVVYVLSSSVNQVESRFVD